jgi:hypothetical protein
VSDAGDAVHPDAIARPEQLPARL